jgi:hypothetical protein
MAEGVRIRPRPELGWPDGALIVVVDHARPFPEPTTGHRLVDVQPVCPRCGVQHFAKNYHLQLRAGTVIVSHEIWSNLQRIPDNPFEYANTVGEPPGQAINPNAREPVQLIEKYSMPIITTTN